MAKKNLSRIIDKLLTDASDRGLSANEIAKRLGVNPSTVSSWRNPERPGLPSREHAAKLARLLGIKSEAIYFGNEPSAPVFSPAENDAIRQATATLTKAAHDANARAERYHLALLGMGKLGLGDELETLRTAFLSALVDRTSNADTHADALAAWDAAVASLGYVQTHETPAS